MYFITSRLADAMPQERLREWHQQRENWLQSHGISDITQFDSLSETERHGFHTVFTAKWHDWLDQGRGECHLRSAHLRELLIQRLFATQEHSCELDA